MAVDLDRQLYNRLVDIAIGKRRSPSGRPFVLQSTAMSIDGKIGTQQRRRLQLSSKKDWQDVDKIRSAVDAIMVGGVTALNDDSHLTVKSSKFRRDRLNRGQTDQPLKVTVVRNAMKLRPGTFLDPKGASVIIFTTKQTSGQHLKRLSNLAKVHVLGKEHVNLNKAMKILRNEYRVQVLMLEGGSTINFEMHDAGLVDRMRIAVSPVIAGGDDAPTLVGGTGFAPKKLIKLKELGVTHSGSTHILHYEVKK